MFFYNKEKIKQEKLKVQASFCKGDGRVLDVGFSANQNFFIKNAVGLDIKLPSDLLPNYTQGVVCNLNTERIPFGDSSFDSVIAGDVIEHLENPSSFLRDVNRILVDGGVLVISTPQANDWWSTLHNWFFRSFVRDSDEGEHLSNWTILDMVRLLKKNGFIVDKIEGYYMRMPKIPIRIRVKRFPVLSWQVFYVAHKQEAPDKRILVKIDGKKVLVNQ